MAPHATRCGHPTDGPDQIAWPRPEEASLSLLLASICRRVDGRRSASGRVPASSIPFASGASPSGDACPPSAWWLPVRSDLPVWGLRLFVRRRLSARPASCVCVRASISSPPPIPPRFPGRMRVSGPDFPMWLETTNVCLLGLRGGAGVFVCACAPKTSSCLPCLWIGS